MPPDFSSPVTVHDPRRCNTPHRQRNNAHDCSLLLPSHWLQALLDHNEARFLHDVRTSLDTDRRARRTGRSDSRLRAGAAREQNSRQNRPPPGWKEQTRLAALLALSRGELIAHAPSGQVMTRKRDLKTLLHTLHMPRVLGDGLNASAQFRSEFLGDVRGVRSISDDLRTDEDDQLSPRG